MTSPEIDSIVEPSVTTSIEIGADYLSLVSGVTNIDHLGPVKTLTITFEEGEPVALAINGKSAIGKQEKTVPFELLDSKTIRVKRGANLSYIARYYDVTVEQLIMCNHLTSSEIYSGQILKLSCCNECPKN